jgi:23S rRNA (cytosine1962-C5)-methyltransferase
MRLLFTEKPAGVTTHTSLNEADKKKPWVDKADGYLEYLELKTGQKLFPVHRLDKETTGAIAFALDRESAELARDAFESRSVYKEYLFLTDGKPKRTNSDSFETESFIEREGNSFVSRSPRTGESANSKTRFELVRTEGRYSLWRAEPETGKPHQIRLHAEIEGIPVLGDTLHGGSAFPALCLHSHKINIGLETLDDSFKLLNEGSFSSEPPEYFKDLSLLKNFTLCKWLAALDRRDRVHRTLKISKPSTYRWIHTEGDPLRVEALGEVVCLNWFRETEPTDSEWQSIKDLCARRGWDTWYLQIRGDRGRAPANETIFMSEPPPPLRWTASEHDLEFEFRRDSGLSPGLFLDQRENRAFVKAKAAETEKVLNLFSYTSGFSVAAAKAGAKQVVSVDVSKPFLEWSKRNFELNGLSTESHEFRAMDAREYVAWAVKKALLFDIVVCDPPSFARGKKDVFRIEKDFEQLFLDCLKLTKPHTGLLFFSTNYEGWSPDDLGMRAQEAIDRAKNESKVSARIIEAPSPDWDFEMPRSPRNMKSVLIAKL